MLKEKLHHARKKQKDFLLQIHTSFPAFHGLRSIVFRFITTGSRITMYLHSKQAALQETVAGC
jgi:hypothetical protein